jgi:hypothetical protein
MADKTTDGKTVKKKAARSARQGTAKKTSAQAATPAASLEEQNIEQVTREIESPPGARPEPETPPAAKAVPKRPLWQRIALRTLRIVGIWIPLSLVVLVALILFGAWLFLSPGRVQQLAVNGFNGASYGTLELDVKSFSPYTGFVIENIVIRNGEEFNRSEFVRIDRLVLDYSFFSIFKGDVRFSEIGIYRPRSGWSA